MPVKCAEWKKASEVDLNANSVTVKTTENGTASVAVEYQFRM